MAITSAALLACGRSFVIGGAEGTTAEGSTSADPTSADPTRTTTADPDCIPSSDTDLCDGIDDDCDGLVDEDATPVVCGAGSCQATVYCEAGVMPECVPHEPAPESCNLEDDDCDGEVDEGFGFGPIADPIVLRTDELETGSCTSCSWAWGATLAPTHDGWLSLWNLGLLGGSEQPTVHGRSLDAAGVPTGPVELLRRDFVIAMNPISALDPMPPFGLPLAVEHRTPGQEDVSGLLFAGVDGTTTLIQPIPGSGPSDVARTVWTGERFVTVWEEEDELRVAVLSADGSLERMVEVDPLVRAATFTLGVFPGRVGLLVSRVRIDLRLWDQWFILLNARGEVVVPAREIDVEYTTWQRVVGTEQGWLHIRPNDFGEVSTRQPLDLEGNPVAEALPFDDGRHLDASGISDIFVPRPGTGEMITAWSGPDGGEMHVEFLDDDGEVLRGWSGPLEADPGYDRGYLIDPHIQIVDDRVLVIWQGLAPDHEPNHVLVRSFGCVP